MARYKTNMEEVEEAAKDMETGGSDRKFFKFKDGKNLIRVLPAYNEKGKFFQRVGYFRDGDNSRIVCTEFTWGEPCPVMRRVDKLTKLHGKDKMKKWALQRRMLFNIIDMRNPKDGVQLMEVGPMIANEILEYINLEGDTTLVDPNKGSNILVLKKGSGLKTKYKVHVQKKAYDLEKEGGMDMDSLYEKMYNLADVPYRPSEEDQQEFLEALGEVEMEDAEDADTDFDDDEDDTPVQTSKKSAKSDTDFDEEEDEDLETEEEEVEEEKPVAAKKAAPAASKKANGNGAKKKAAPVEVEDDEDDDMDFDMDVDDLGMDDAPFAN